jgi:glutathione S-transferase
VIRLYRAHWSTNCERVALALAHKDLEVASVLISYSDRSVVERVSGQPLVPVIEEEGDVIFDSIAILRHLDEHHPEPRLFPDDPTHRAEVDAFIEWFERVWKGAPNGIEEELAKPQPDRTRVSTLAARMDAWLDWFEHLLAVQDFLMGDELSAADCAGFPFLKYARGRDPEDDEPFHRILDEHQTVDGRPRFATWIDRVDELPREYGQTVEDYSSGGRRTGDDGP